MWHTGEFRTRSDLRVGTNALSKAVTAKHCLTNVNMDEGNVQSDCQIVAMVWDFGSAVSGCPCQDCSQSQQPQKQPVGTEAAAASGPGDQRIVHGRPREAFGEIAWDITDNFCTLLQITTRSWDVSVARHCCSSRASMEIATLLLRTSRKCDADLHKNLYVSAMLIDGAAMFQEIGEYTAEDRT